MSFLRIFILTLFLIIVQASYPYNFLQVLPDRPTVVHLFEWKWADIANECETFLSKYQYGVVQISPANDHLMQTTVLSDGRIDLPWWVRYQPISYKLQSRSGSTDELADMINRCNNVGIRIIVDVVTNHMASVNQKAGQYGANSSAGSYFDSTDGIESFPSVPYSNLDFHDPYCHGDIQDSDYQNNSYNVRMCRLSGLLDLDQGKDYVRQKIANYLNSLIDLGVAGFRMDAIKHMWPDDVAAILNMVKNLNSTIYGQNQRPFIVQEVSDYGGEAISYTEYLNTGRITNFPYGTDVTDAVWKKKDFEYFDTFGPNWDLMQDITAFNFIDNHDTQRDGDVLTYKAGVNYVMAVTYMLAWSYGYARVMSSYDFNDRDQGPPTVGYPTWNITSATFETDETCSPKSGWICEHRWPEIRRMAVFRGVVQGTAAANIVSENNRVAFRRGSKGFFALNNVDREWNRRFYVGLPGGTYCDVISGEYDTKRNECTGITIIVESDGNANIVVPNNTTLAIHIKQRLTPAPSPTPIPLSYQRTVIMIQKNTTSGENVFIRGGLQDGSNCSQYGISIVHQTNVSQESLIYIDWNQEDEYLDWFGGELNQGTYDGIEALGTPLTYTTNDTCDINYNALNTYGPNYWLVDLMMDCTKTRDGWFSLKGYIKNEIQGIDGRWENDIMQTGRCSGNAKAVTPSDVFPNHAGLCGMMNVFTYDRNDCEINRFDD